MLAFVAVIMTSCSLFLASHREVADTLHITDDTSQIINILTVTFRTLLKVVLAYVSAVIADCIRDIEGEVVASLLCSDAQKLAVLCLCEMFFKVKMKG